MRLPKISIVTPSYNQGRFLEATIRSVLSQQYPSLEYIIIDGASTDDSFEIIRKYESHLCYWQSERDRGQAHALNKGLSHATGEIIGWLNSDDLYLANCLKVVGAHFAEHPDVDVVYGDYQFVDSVGRILLRKKEIAVDFNIMLYARNPICQPTVFFRKVLLDRVGLFREDLSYGMDWDMWFRMGKAGFRFEQIRQELAAFRWQGDSKSVTNQAGALRERRRLQQAYAEANWKGVPTWSIPILLYVLDVLYRVKWHAKKALTRGTFDLLHQRIRLRRSKHVRGKC